MRVRVGEKVETDEKKNTSQQFQIQHEKTERQAWRVSLLIAEFLSCKWSHFIWKYFVHVRMLIFYEKITIPCLSANKEMYSNGKTEMSSFYFSTSSQHNIYIYMEMRVCSCHVLFSDYFPPSIHSHSSFAKIIIKSGANFQPTFCCSKWIQLCSHLVETTAGWLEQTAAQPLFFTLFWWWWLKL